MVKKLLTSVQYTEKCQTLSEKKLIHYAKQISLLREQQRELALSKVPITDAQ